MSNQKIEVDFVGKSLRLRMSNPTTGVTGAYEYYPVCNFVSLNGQAFIGFATRNVQTNQRRQRYSSDNMTKVFIETNGTHQLDIEFDLNDVINQAGWTPDFAGMEQAKSDINTWISSCSDPSGGAGGGSLEATQQAVLTAIQNHQDFETKLVRDEGNGDKVVCEVAEYDEGTDTYSYSYKDVGGAPYAPTGPLVYLDPDATLNLMLTEILALTDSKTATKLYQTTNAVIPAGATEVSILNLGAANITVNGLPLPPGVKEEYGFKNPTDAAINIVTGGEQFIAVYMI
jgi:hypothetical protein